MQPRSVRLCGGKPLQERSRYFSHSVPQHPTNYAEVMPLIGSNIRSRTLAKISKMLLFPKKCTFQWQNLIRIWQKPSPTFEI